MLVSFFYVISCLIRLFLLMRIFKKIIIASIKWVKKLHFFKSYRRFKAKYIGGKGYEKVTSRFPFHQFRVLSFCSDRGK